MFSAQTWTRSPRDTLDRVERAAPHADHERPQIEGRLKFDFLAVARNFERERQLAHLVAPEDVEHLVLQTDSVDRGAGVALSTGSAS